MVRLSISLLLVSLSCFGATFPNFYTTNTGSGISAPADGWLMAWSNPVPVWTLQGRLLTNLNLLQATNNDTVVSNGLYSQIVGSTVWTNDGTSIWPVGQPPPDLSGSVPGSVITIQTNPVAAWFGTNVFKEENPNLPGIKMALTPVESEGLEILNDFQCRQIVGASLPYVSQIYQDIVGDRDGSYVIQNWHVRTTNGNNADFTIYLDTFGGSSLSLLSNSVSVFNVDPINGIAADGHLITGLTNALDTIVDVNVKILSATNNALTLATNNDLLIGLNGSNNVMVASNTLWLSASNLVYQGTNVSISQKVSTNESRSLVFTSSTNRLGTNVNADFFWGDISHGTGLTAGQIPNIAESQVTGLQADLDARVTTNTTRSLVWTSSTNNLGTNVSAVTFYGALNGNATTATTATSATTATYVTGNNAALTNHIPIANVDSPGVIMTNGGTTSITYSNTFKLDAAHALSLSNIAASKVLRTAADSTVAAVTIGSGVAFDGTTLTATGSGGTVTSVGVAGANGLTVSGSPVSGSGTITVGAQADILTNNLAFAAVLSNAVSMDVSHALSLSNATISRVLMANAAGQVTNVASGAVPIDGDGTATTSAQLATLGMATKVYADATTNGLGSAAFTASSAYDAAGVGAAAALTATNSITWQWVQGKFPSIIVTNNNANALVFSNTLKFDVAHALSLSNATASHVLMVAADSTVSSVSSGAVPIDGDGTATTSAQVNSLFPSNILTNNNTSATVFSNTMKFDAAHALSLSNATASHVLQVGADSTVTSVSSGAVPIDGNGSATTFAQVNALASADILTNNLSFATVISNTLKMDAAHALSLSNATASHVLKVGADSTVTSVASGAVPIDGDGTATTFAQVNALAADILTNGTTLSVTFSNNTAVDAAHTLTANGPLTVGGVSTVVDVIGSGTNALNITASTNNVVWKTANYALLANDTFVFISGNHTTTMPPPSNPSCYGKWYYINVSSAGTNAILPNGAETFNGSSGTALAKLTNTAVGKLISLYSNRTNWWYVINP